MLINKKINRSIIEDRAQKALNLLERSIEQGNIRSEEALFNRIEQLWKEVFFESLSSTVVVPEFRKGELPMKSMLEDPLFASQDDIRYLWETYREIREKLKEQFNIQTAQVKSLEDLIGTVQNKTTRFQLFSSDSESLFLWSSDSFTSMDKIDRERTTAFIDIKAGYATLFANRLDSLNKYIAKFTIDKDSSVGIPGNNLVIASEEQSSPDSNNQEPQVILEGKTDLRAQVSYIFDGQPTSWMEWENNYIPRFQKCKSIQTAFVKDSSGTEIDILEKTKDISGEPAGWRKFVQWPGSAEYDRKDGKGYFLADFEKNTPARLSFTIDLDEARKVSTIQIVPHIIAGMYPIVRSIEVIQDGSNGYKRTVAKDVYLTKKLNESLKSSRSGIPEGNYTGTGIWSIPDKSVKSIRVTLESGGSYEPDLGFGHQYYFRILNKKNIVKVLFASFVSNKQVAERLPNPDQGISTGAKTNDLSQVGEVAGLIFGGVLGGAIGKIAGSLIGWGTETSLIREGTAYDIFQGKRNAIGLKDIEISVREYAEESVIYSTPHYFPKPVKAVSIITTEDIPEDWDSQEDWITYEVSQDGKEWKSIIPQNRSKGASDTVFLNKAQQVFLRITLRRPKDRVNEGSILNHYAIKAITE